MTDNLGTVPPPQPPPKPEGEDVLPSLLRWLFDRGHLARLPDLAVKLLARDAVGRRKYGQPLRADDGRDDGRDLEEEILDALQYAHRAILRGTVTSKQRRLVAVLRDALVGGRPASPRVTRSRPKR